MSSTEKILTNPELPNTPEYCIPDVLVLDFDRMLGDVSACMERFYTAASTENIDGEEIAAARIAVEDESGSFEPLSYVKAELNSESYERFCRNFIFQQGPPVLYPDAARFLSLLQYADIPHTAMTYGVNPEWQQLKLMASGYPMGFTITDAPDKGDQLRHLRTTTDTGEPGTFDMYVAAHGRAIYHANALTFIDDKAVAFSTFPQEEGYKGLWLQRGNLLPSQTGDVPPNVTVIHSLDELTVTEDGSLILGKRPEKAPYRTRRERWMYPRYPYLFSPAYESVAVYAPLQKGTKITGDAFSGYESFWTVTQVQYNLAHTAFHAALDSDQIFQ